jgi:hypothetical protein
MWTLATGLQRRTRESGVNRSPEPDRVETDLLPERASIAQQSLPAPHDLLLANLAAHFDAVLRHGEALRALARPATVDAFSGLKVGAIIRRNRDASAIAQEAHALELAIVLRLQQAQRLLEQAGRTSSSRAALLRLIATVASTVTSGDPRRATGPADDFFASRGLGEPTGSGAVFGEGYRVSGVVPLSTVMDAAAAALDTIDNLKALSA